MLQVALPRWNSVTKSSCSTVELAQQAESLKSRSEAAFWSEELGSYALALDGLKRPCLVAASNAGQVLRSGIAGDRYAASVADLTDKAPGTLLHVARLTRRPRFDRRADRRHRTCRRTDHVTATSRTAYGARCSPRATSPF